MAVTDTQNFVDQHSQTTFNTAQKTLTDQHYKECVDKRKLDRRWIEVNCRSVTTEEASMLLGYQASSGGIWMDGVGIQGQLMPDKPWISQKDKAKGKKKAPKYRAPQDESGDYDVMLPLHPDDPNYWSDLEALKRKCYVVDDYPCLVLTEGFWKAIAGCSNDIPTIALLSVSMGLTSSKADLQGKRYLVKTLEQYAKAGFGFIIGFDADCTTNELVLWEQRKLIAQLKLFKVPLYSITGLWTVDEGKGMDDYIQINGANRFKCEVMGKAVNIETWEKQFQQPLSGDYKKTNKIPPADIVACEIAEQYRNELRFNNEIGGWMRYGTDFNGQWSVETDEYVESIISNIIDGKGITGYNSNSYIVNIVKKLRHILIERKWQEHSPNKLLPFRNGVLEVATGELLSHSPAYLLTWQLPRIIQKQQTGVGLMPTLTIYQLTTLRSRIFCCASVMLS